MIFDESSSRPLNRLSLTALVVASMIGAGVYTTSGFAMADLGSAWLVLSAWFLGGLIAICGAVAYGRLAARLAESGGEYLYLSRFAHPAAGFIAGWVSLLAGFTSAGAYAASAFETYALPPSVRPEWLPAGTLAIGLVAAATLLHAFHTGRGAIGQNVVVVLKLSLLTLFIVVSLWGWEHWHGTAPSAPTAEKNAVTPLDFATSVMWISLSYSGFNAAIYVAGEARGGGRDVGAAMVGGTLLVTLVYLVLNAIFVLGPSPAAISGRADVAAIAAEAIGGTALSTTVRAAICLGLASSVSAALMAGPRVYAKMAADGLFPRLFHTRHSPPRRTVLLQGVAIAIVVVFVELKDLLSYLGLTLSISAAATVGTLFLATKYQSDHASLQGRRRTITDSIAPALYVLATLTIAALAAWNRPAEALAAAVTILTGAALYPLAKWAHRR